MKKIKSIKLYKLKKRVKNFLVLSTALAAYCVLCGAVVEIAESSAVACFTAMAMVIVLFLIGYANHFWDNPRD